MGHRRGEPLRGLPPTAGSSRGPHPTPRLWDAPGRARAPGSIRRLRHRAGLGERHRPGPRVRCGAGGRCPRAAGRFPRAPDSDSQLLPQALLLADPQCSGPGRFGHQLMRIPRSLLREEALRPGSGGGGVGGASGRGRGWSSRRRRDSGVGGRSHQVRRGEPLLGDQRSPQGRRG